MRHDKVMRWVDGYERAGAPAISTPSRLCSPTRLDTGSRPTRSPRSDTLRSRVFWQDDDDVVLAMTASPVAVDGDTGKPYTVTAPSE